MNETIIIIASLAVIGLVAFFAVRYVRAARQIGYNGRRAHKPVRISFSRLKHRAYVRVEEPIRKWRNRNKPKATLVIEKSKHIRS